MGQRRKKFIKNIYNDLRTKNFFLLSFRIFFMSYPKDFVLRSILLFFLFILKYFWDDYFYDYFYYFSKKKKILAYKRSLPIWENFFFKIIFYPYEKYDRNIVKISVCAH